jgi:hypothetical protein
LADDVAAKRGRLAVVESELRRLRHRHDLAMSAFRFEEATALGPAIAVLEKEQQTLLAELPAAEPPAGVVPALARPRGRVRPRPRR